MSLEIAAIVISAIGLAITVVAGSYTVGQKIENMESTQEDLVDGVSEVCDRQKNLVNAHKHMHRDLGRVDNNVNGGIKTEWNDCPICNSPSVDWEIDIEE